MPTVYNKLFTKILDSSIWLASDTTRIVWITLIAAMDEDGFCPFATVENLAARARVELKAAKKAVEQLESPEPETATDDDDGRRIERIAGGWLVINADKYRNMVTRIVAREQTRERVRRHRAKKSAVTQCNACNDLKQNVTPSEAVSEAEAYTDHKRERPAYKKFEKPTMEMISLQASKIGLSALEAEKFFNHYEANGWRTGRGKVVSWTHLLTGWKLRQNQYENHAGTNRRGFDRNKGTFNEGKAHLYKAKPIQPQTAKPSVPNVPRSEAG